MNNSEPRARSRLSKPSAAVHDKPVSSQPTKLRLKKQSLISRGSFFTLPKIAVDSELLAKYLTAVPFLIVSLVLYGILIYIFSSVPPQTVANWLVYQSYIPVLVIFFFATVFLSRFILLRKTLAWSVGLWLTVLLFLKLQLVVLTVPVIIITGVVLVGPFLIWPVLFGK